MTNMYEKHATFNCKIVCTYVCHVRAGEGRGSVNQKSYVDTAKVKQLTTTVIGVKPVKD